MRSFSEQFKNAFENHRDTLTELNELMESFDIETTVNENIELKKTSEDQNTEILNLKKANNDLNSEVSEFKRKYKDLLLSEKLTYLGQSKKRMNFLFKGSVNSRLNKLTETENTIKEKFRRFQEKIQKEDQSIATEYTSKLNALFEEFNLEVETFRTNIEKESEKIHSESDGAYESSDLGGVSEEVIEESYKVNNVELKLGLNVLNKLGVVLVLFAIILAGRYTFSNWFTDYMKGMASFSIGIALLLFGEMMYRRTVKIFGLGLIGGGIGVLYASTFISYFNLGIMTLQMTLFISVVISAAALLLTLRYQSSIICSMAFIGGYLPFFTYVYVFGLEQLPVNAALAYLTMFNVLVLGISVKHKWYPVIYMSFFFNILCSNFLIGIMDTYWIGIVYSYVLFAIYSAVVIMRNIRDKEALRVPDLILLVMNSIINVSMVYYLFTKAGFEDFDGLLALVYALIYFVFARIMEKRHADLKMVNAFYVFAIGFTILMIPLQITSEWLFFGWIIESLVFIYYGQQSENKAFKYLGNALFGISHFVFVLFAAENVFNIESYPSIFDLKYLSLLLSEVAVMWIYRETETKGAQGDLSKVYRYVVIAHGAAYLIYNANMIYLDIFGEGFEFIYYSVVLTSLVVLGYNKLIQFMGAEGWINLEVYRKVTNTLAYMYLVVLNILPLPSNHGIEYGVGVFLLIGANVLIIIKANSLFKELEKTGGMKRDVRAVILGVYTFCIYYMNLVVKFQPDNWSMTINLSMVIFALIYIFIGFKERFTTLRRMGLGLSLVATAKMTLFDLASTTMVQKIVGFFIFGFVLIAISYIYQKLSEKIAKEEVAS